MAVTAGGALLAALRDNVDRLLAAEPKVRADAVDSVHQMRVATRRLRSILRSYRRLFERAPGAAMGDELKWLAHLLGVARDAEVRADRFAALLAEHTPAGAESVASELVAAQQEVYAAAHADVLDALDGHRYRKLRNELAAWRTDPPLDRRKATQPAEDVFTRVLRRDRKRLRRLVFAEPTVPATERIELLHDIRKGAKRLRYSCEGAGEILRSAATDLGAQAKRLQTVLGDHRDAVESRDTILARAAAESHATGAAATIYELLADAEEAEAGRALAHYPAAAAFVASA